MPYGTVNADLMTTSDGVSSSGLYGFKNRIINGAMTISQRGSTNVTAAGGNIYVAADRFCMFNYFGSGQINTATSTSVVPSGYSNSLSLTVNTAVPLSGTTGYLVNVAQTIEGFNIADCYNQSITLSFWVRSSITGTYTVSFYNASNAGATSATRWYNATYTINSANTWEQKTITVSLSAGTASGTWLSDNGVGLNIAWGLGAESVRKGNTYLNTWGTVGTTYDFQVSSQTQWASTAGATFYITGVQLEKGSVATSFDYRPYGTELALCQRYFWKVGGTAAYEQIAMGLVDATTQVSCITSFPVAMRAAPSVGYSSASAFNVNDAASQASTTAVAIYQPGLQTTGITVTSSGLNLGRAARFFIGNSTSAYINFSAEL